MILTAHACMYIVLADECTSTQEDGGNSTTGISVVERTSPAAGVSLSRRLTYILTVHYTHCDIMIACTCIHRSKPG